jgi:hypothetical protein
MGLWLARCSALCMRLALVELCPMDNWHRRLHTSAHIMQILSSRQSISVSLLLVPRHR